MIIYQVALRTFTPEGTLRAATPLLSHIASLGADTVYLCPVFTAEDDEDTATWSPRQRASGMGNPKNPYKMKDYFSVDEEYGTDEDLRLFIKEAHRLGLKVLLDLVYLHCGKGAVFVEKHPTFILRNEDGSSLVGKDWPFARLNFENEELREYLYQNMEMLALDFGADGFRCDVGDQIPLDFWVNAFERLRQKKPSLITLNEGAEPSHLFEAFDHTYSWAWTGTLPLIFEGKESLDALRKLLSDEKKLYGERTRDITRAVETHDSASDSGVNRKEKTMTSRGVEAALVLSTTYEGIPFLWNGYELCDEAQNCMFSNRDHGAKSAMDWSRAFTRNGKRRLSIVKKLFTLRKRTAALMQGKTREWQTNRPQDIFAFIRTYENEHVLVLINCRNKTVPLELPTLRVEEVLMQSGVRSQNGQPLKLAPYGYFVARLSFDGQA